MAACRMVYNAIEEAINTITKTAYTDYIEAANSFEDAFTASISQMEGVTKDALQDYFQNKVLPFLKETVPSTVNGMAVLLQENMSRYIEKDQQMANSIIDS